MLILRCLNIATFLNRLHTNLYHIGLVLTLYFLLKYRNPSSSQVTTEADTEHAHMGYRMKFLEFSSEDGAVFVLLSVFIIATFFASVFIIGALFTNRGVFRPFNQVSNDIQKL